MSKGKVVKIDTIEDFASYIEQYCCIFDIILYNVRPKVNYEHFIPRSKCWICEDAILDNGKIDKASKIGITITEIDYKIYSKFYDWDYMEIGTFRYYLKGYLPKNFILAILQLYQKKTTLKGVEEKVMEYMQAKGDINSAFGMAVMDICKPEIDYVDNEWIVSEIDYNKLINKYNKSRNRFLFYLWGVYITAYAKRNLTDAIAELKYDYIYSDTDSVKFLNLEKHKKFFDEYNINMEKKLLKMCDTFKINPELIRPKTIKGETKILGVWDYEGMYKRAKFIRSKCYMVEFQDSTHSFTIAGCNKKLAIPYLEKICSHYRCDIFDLFDESMHIPKEITMKNIHSYLDYKQDGIIIDYQGNKYEFHELSSVHLEATDFTLNLSEQFLNYLEGERGVL